MECEKCSKLEARVKRLTKALEDIKEHDLLCGVNSCGHKSIDIMVTRALEEE